MKTESVIPKPQTLNASLAQTPKRFPHDFPVHPEGVGKDRGQGSLHVSQVFQH